MVERGGLAPKGSLREKPLYLTVRRCLNETIKFVSLVLCIRRISYKVYMMVPFIMGILKTSINV